MLASPLMRLVAICILVIWVSARVQQEPDNLDGRVGRGAVQGCFFAGSRIPEEVVAVSVRFCSGVYVGLVINQQLNDLETGVVGKCVM